MSFDIYLRNMEKTALSQEAKARIAGALTTAGLYAGANSLRPRYASDRLRAAGRGAAAGLGDVIGTNIGLRVSPHLMLPGGIGGAVAGAHLANKFIPHRTKEQREQEESAKASAKAKR